MQSLQQEYQKVNVDDLISGYNLFLNSQYQESLKFFELKQQNDIRYLIGYARVYLSQNQIESIPPYNQIKNMIQLVYTSILKLYNVKADIETEKNIYQISYFELSVYEQTLIDWSWIQFIQINYLLYDTNLKHIPESILKFIRFHFTEQKTIYAYWALEYLNKNPLKIPVTLYDKEVQITQGVDMDNVWIIISQIKIISQMNIEYGQEEKANLLKNSSIMFPNFDLVHLFRGDSCIHNNHIGFSRQHYDRCLQLNPQNYIALNNKGYSYEYDNKYTETDIYNDKFLKAIEYYKQAISICPTYWILYNNIGACHKNLNQYEKSAEYFTQSIEINNGYLNGASRVVESLSFIIDSPEIKDILIRCYVLAEKQVKCFQKLIVSYSDGFPLTLQKMIQQGIKHYPFQTYMILHQLKDYEVLKMLPILDLAIDEFQFISMVAAYSKNIKQLFQYQASHFYWDLYID